MISVPRKKDFIRAVSLFAAYELQYSFMRWVTLGFLLTSAALTYHLMNKLDRFYVVDQQTLADSNFIEPGKYWKNKNGASRAISFSLDSLSIENSRSDSNEVSQRVRVSAPVFVQLSVEASATGLSNENKYWAGGSAAVVSYATDGARLRHTNVLNLKTASAFRKYSKIILIKKDVATISVALRLLRSKGKVTYRNPELSILAEIKSFKIVKNLLVVHWCLVALVLAIWACKSLSFKTLSLIGGLSVVAIIGVLLPGGLVTAFNKWFMQYLPGSSADSIQSLILFFYGNVEAVTPTASISKFAHFLVFMLIGVLIGQAFRRVGLYFGVALIAVFAVVTESLQTLVFGRSTSVQDVYIDLSGALVGLIAGVGCILLLEKLRRQTGTD